MPPSRMPRTGNEGKQMKRLLSDLWKGYKKELIIENYGYAERNFTDGKSRIYDA